MTAERKRERESLTDFMDDFRADIPGSDRSYQAIEKRLQRILAAERRATVERIRERVVVYVHDGDPWLNAGDLFAVLDEEAAGAEGTARSPEGSKP